MIPQLGELHIRNMNRDDCTAYRCVAYSALVNESCQVQLNLTYRSAGQAQAPSTKPFFDPAQREVSVELGDTVELPCVASAARPTARVWEFAAQGGAKRALPTDDKFGRVGNTSNLLIHSVRLAEAGDYTCRASNSFGDNQVQYRLTVRSQLRVSVRPAEMTADLGSTRAFECDYSGSPLDELVWLKDGERLLSARRLSSGEIRLERAGNASHVRAANERASSIEISNVSSSDRGVYQCLVVNSFDSAQASASLLIGAPVFLDEPPSGSSQTVQPGANVTVRCVVTASPLPTVTWFCDDVPVLDAAGVRVDTRFVLTDTLESTLTLTNVNVINAGEYRCEAKSPNQRIVSSNIRTLHVYGKCKPKRNRFRLSSLRRFLAFLFYLHFSSKPLIWLSVFRSSIPIFLIIKFATLNFH